jgi:hypothetical protein
MKYSSRSLLLLLGAALCEGQGQGLGRNNASANAPVRGAAGAPVRGAAGAPVPVAAGQLGVSGPQTALRPLPGFDANAAASGPLRPLPGLQNAATGPLQPLPGLAQSTGLAVVQTLPAAVQTLPAAVQTLAPIAAPQGTVVNGGGFSVLTVPNSAQTGFQLLRPGANNTVAAALSVSYLCTASLMSQKFY